MECRFNSQTEEVKWSPIWFIRRWTLLKTYLLQIANFKTRSIQKTQTPPRLWPLTLCRDLDLSSRSRMLMLFITCRLLYCTLVPGMMSVGLILYEISPLVYFMWHLTFTCDLQPLSRSLDLLSLDVHYVVESKNEVCRFSRIWNMDILWSKPKWRHHEVITHLIFIKFKNKYAKGISLNGELNFSLIRQRRAEIYNKKLTETYEENMDIE